MRLTELYSNEWAERMRHTHEVRWTVEQRAALSNVLKRWRVRAEGTTR